MKLREILVSFQIGFNLVNAAVVCAILESISGLGSPSVITESRNLKLMTVSSFCPSSYFYLCVDAAGVCHLLGLISIYYHAVVCLGFVETLN